MSYRERIKTFRTRWNITVEDAVEFERFQNRLSDAIGIVFMSTVRHYDAPMRTLALLCGYQFFNEHHARFYEFSFAQELHIANTVPRLIELSQALLWTLQEHMPEKVQDAVKALKDVFDVTPHLEIDILGLEKSFVLYPAGAGILDKALVEDNLGWLSDHPEVLKHYKTALQQILSGDEANQRNALDNLRFALEQLLKEILENNKSLENQQETLLKWLAMHGIHSDVISMYNGLLFGGFAKYQNDAVKHHERWKSSEIEFMVYTTGAFMRLLLQLESAKK